METEVRQQTLSDLAAMIGGEPIGNADLVITRLVPAGSDDPSGLTFADSDAFLAKCLASQVGAVLVKKGSQTNGKPAILVNSPRLAFVRLLTSFARPLHLAQGVDPRAVVSPDAFVDSTASIGAFSVIEAGAKVGAGCRVFPFCYVGSGCVLGDSTVMFPHSVLYQDVAIGKRCVVHAGAVVGADGFGFFWDGIKQEKVPQIGGVIIGDDVEVGANSCIDRATCGDTLLGGGVKIDNLVQVGHNVVIGDHSVLASHTCIGGSTTVGSRVSFGGNVAVADHVNIVDDAAFGGCSAVFQDIDEAGQYLGLPPVPVSAAMRQMALQKRLPELFKRLKSLEEEVKRLKKDD